MYHPRAARTRSTVPWLHHLSPAPRRPPFYNDTVNQTLVRFTASVPRSHCHIRITESTPYELDCMEGLGRSVDVCWGKELLIKIDTMSQLRQGSSKSWVPCVDEAATWCSISTDNVTCFFSSVVCCVREYVHNDSRAALLNPAYALPPPPNSGSVLMMVNRVD